MSYNEDITKEMLFMETRKDIIQKQLSKGREIRASVKELRNEGMSIVDIANKLGISESTVRNVK
jgi:DNA-binding NarL/FixJ family response regulator